MQSIDPGHFFQTSSSIQATERKAAKSQNKNGDPIRLPSKILAVIPDPTPGGESCIFVAESASTARRLDIANTEEPNDHIQTEAQKPRTSTRKIYRGPAAPVTSLAVSPDSKTLFAGCWDKCVWSWDIETSQPQRKYAGHSDFVKSVLCASIQCRTSDSSNSGSNENENQTEPSTLDLLISGSADASIIIWSIATGQKLHTIRGGEHTRGILDLAIDPSSLVYPGAPSSSSNQHREHLTLYAGSSDPQIRRWTVSASTPSSITVAEAGPPISVHETSVNNLHFCHIPEDDEDYDDNTGGHTPPIYALLTASSDNTAKHLILRRGANASTNSAPAFTEKATFAHPDFVRAVVVAASTPQGTLIATACRDEEVRVFDGASGERLCTFTGHFEEVTDLAVVRVQGRTVLVSVGIDGTVRRWGFEPGDIDAARAREEDGGGGEEQEGGKGEEKKPGVAMTAEEEAELAELMDSDGD